VRLSTPPTELSLTDVALVVDASQARFSAGEYPFAPDCADLAGAAGAAERAVQHQHPERRSDHLGRRRRAAAQFRPDHPLPAWRQFLHANQWLQKAGRGAVNWNLTTVANPTAEVCIWGWNPSSKSSYCQETCTMSRCSFAAAAEQAMMNDGTDQLRYYRQLLMPPLLANA